MPETGILPPSPAPRGSQGSRRAPSFGTKISLGCGVLLLAFLATCGAFTWIAKRQANTAADQGWVQLRAPFARLQDDPGAVALYRESPGLQSRFGSEAAFLAAVKGWRDRLEALPVQRPRLRDLLGEDGSRFRIRNDAVKGQPRTWIRYVQPGGATFTVEFEQGRIVDLDVQ